MTFWFGSYIGLMYWGRISGLFKYDHKLVVVFGIPFFTLSPSLSPRKVPMDTIISH